MANINDFKLLNLKCQSYFKILQNEVGKEIITKDDKTKERLGFYLYMIESICNVKDTLDIIELVTDTEFNSCVFDTRDEDHGIDAIYIDEQENNINLFNFKFRDKFNEDKRQSINETILTTKFANTIVTEKTDHLSGKLRKYADLIIEKLNSNDIWKLKLYVVSNEKVVLEVNSSEVKQLQDLYDLEVIPIGLDIISKYMSIRPEPINATLHLDKDAIMPFVEDSLSSSKSYVLRIPVTELIRISCDNKELRDKYNIEDLSPLTNVGMEYNLLFDNVRGLIIGSKYNSNIFDTLKSEPSKFFMYNNGLTITASDIVSEDTNGHKKIKLVIKDFQVVNGGQTLRTMHNFNSMDIDNISKYLSHCEVLLRVFKTTSNDSVRNRIAEYTNSQNAISSIDLKSLSAEQIQIEQFLDENDIIYARKIGDTGLSKDKRYLHKISMEKFGQILFSIAGSPEKASNQKKQIFDKYYKQIFNDNFDITKSAEYVRRYFEVKKVYDLNTNGFESSDQKVFYILYMESYIENSIIDKILLLEEMIKNYNSGAVISDARKLIQVKFKDFVFDTISKSSIPEPIFPN